MSDTTPTKQHRGFATLTPERRRAIASAGGKAAHARGTAHEFTPAEATEAARKGGAKTSTNREHMAAIGRRGGVRVSADREHMRAIGRKGGSKVGKAQQETQQSNSQI